MLQTKVTRLNAANIKVYFLSMDCESNINLKEFPKQIKADRLENICDRREKKHSIRKDHDIVTFCFTCPLMHL